MTAPMFRPSIALKALAAVFTLITVALLVGGIWYYRTQGREIPERRYESNVAARSANPNGMLPGSRFRTPDDRFAVGVLILLAASLNALVFARLFKGLFQSERRQREIHEQFRTILYSIGDAVITTNAEGRVQTMNPVAEQLTGWSEAEARDRPLDDVFVILNQETRDPVINPVTTVLRDGVIVGLANHTVLIARDGTEHSIADSAAPIRDSTGVVNGVVLVVSDVTAQYQAREALRRSEQDYRMLFEGMLEGFALHEIICDNSGNPVDYRFLSINPAFEQMTGLRAEDLLGRTVREVMPEIESVWIERYGRVAQTGEPISFDDYSAPLDRHFRIAAFRPQAGQFAVVFDDISQSKAAEARIAQLTQLYAALSQCNQSIVHSVSVEELLPQICRHVVQLGGLKMAWIGLVDEATQLVLPAAAYGSGSEYLQGIQVSADPEHPSGRGPTGFSIRENQPFWCEDFLNDPLTAPWHDRGALYGWAAYASIPLRLKGKPMGALIVYSDRHEAFDDEVRNLLLELADDISFALESFVRETERKQAEEELRKSEARLNFALQTNQTGAWELDLLDHTSERTLLHDRIFGYETLLPNWTYEMFLEHILPEDRPKVDQSFRKAITAQSEWNFECRIRRADGEIRWILAAGNHERNPEGKAVKMAGIVQDITGRRNAEKLLRESEENFRLLAENTSDVIWIVDSESRNYRYISPSVERLRGYTVEEVMKQSSASALTPTSLEYYRSLDPYRQERFRQGYIEFFTDEVQQFHKDGHIIETEVTSRLTINPETGRMEGVGVTRDITARKQAERALRESQARLQAALASMTDAVFISDATGHFIEFNDAFAKFHRFNNKAECARRLPDYPDILEVFLSNGKPAPLEMWAVPRALRGETATNAEYTLRRKDTGETWVGSYSFAPIRDKDGVVVGSVVVGRDITEYKQMADKMLQAQRMESLGKLAAGVAHDLNNIITPIILAADMLRGSEDAANREFLISSIEESAKRGASVVNQVLTFARGVKGARTRVQLKDLVAEMERIMQETFPKNITITSSIPADLRPVTGDSTQIHQVILNLCINARDAMPDGGTLLILGANAEIDENFAAMAPGAKPGNYAMLTISDSGTGIPREIIGKIFDPFFTTKEVGNGTGLGLSTVFGIIRSHNGFITVESKEGYGSTFKVFLPIETVEVTEPQRSKNKEPHRGNGELVLVVDDEIVITRTTSLVLKNNGYNVICANAGTDALALYAEHANAVNMVLTDIMMPGMDGTKLTRALKEINPQVKIVAFTGHATKTLQAELQTLGINVILSKPYDITTLLATVHHAIHEEPYANT